MVEVLDSGNFDAKVVEAKGLTLVDMYATWCGPCKMLAPIVEKLAEELPDVAFGKLDVDQNAAIAERYNVSSIPALVLFRDGVPVETSAGLLPKEKIASMIQRGRA